MFVFDEDRPTVESTALGLMRVSEALAKELRKRVYDNPTDNLTATAAQMLSELEAVLYHAEKLDKLRWLCNVGGTS